ncbi:MAG: adenylosuccinate lyase [Candidatus Ozemobacteraceae bacterium]
MLKAISPLDGRYSVKTASLSEVFSEYALIRSRCRVEIMYLFALEKTRLFPAFTDVERIKLSHLVEHFSEFDADRVKEIEAVTKHDVKALEFFLREQLQLVRPNMIHFGLTSEDVNNLAYSLLFKRFVDDFQVPAIERLILRLCALAGNIGHEAFPTRTHGQPASPSTAGKEISVFISRLTRMVHKLKQFKFQGKCNGAVGNYSAMLAAFPDFDWAGFSRDFVEKMGFSWNATTTQVEDHDSWAEYFNLTRGVNTILMDFNVDVWTYLMLGLFHENAEKEEVGSSTMPHKVNPIRFENSEGNLYVSNALLAMMAEKLPRSRLQRDLSDSTVSRNIGVALAHSWLAILETFEGVLRLRINKKRCEEELESSTMLLAEPIQTMLRPIIQEDPYVLLKEFTRGKEISEADLHQFIDGLSITPEWKAKMKLLKPSDYVGEAAHICRLAIEKAFREIEQA